MTTQNDLRMDKTKFSVTGLASKSDDVEYWQNQSSAARLEALELMRQVIYGYDATTARLQRVLEVIERPSS